MSDPKTALLDRTNKSRAVVRAKPHEDSAASTTADDPLWYKDAVVYQLHVKSFMDANGDGIGDFAGLLTKLDYIASLGVNTIWLLPFYPSPRRDDGYDIAEYTGVHADYGTMADVKRFIHEAHKRELRVITELVINHTSDQHQWFQKARAAKPGSAARNYYVWSDNDQAYAGTRIIFCDTEKSNWTWDPVAGAYFWHRFFSHQPDLNFDNPQVMKAVLNVMRWWLDLGIDGLRLDAVPYLVEREGTSNENLPETHDILKLIRTVVDREYPGRLLLAEANMWPEDTQQYFGDGDECHMAFHFPLMPRMYMAIAQEDRFPITDILRQTPEIPSNCQWAIFLRNHDELTLEMVTDKERDYLWNFYASDRRARINLGIRRRLAPLMERDRRRIELLNSLLLSMPGTPVMYYGDEIGMGDNIHLGDRDGVRTPMQWSPDRNGGFSRANPASLVLPAIMDPLYGFDAVNVETQDTDPHSMLNWTRRMLAIRSQHQAFGRGRLRMLAPINRKILAYLREHESGDDGADGRIETILCVANVSRSAQAVELELSEFSGRVPVEMIGGSMFPAIGTLPYVLTLPPYGFFWFMLAAEAELPTWHVAAPEALPDYMTLVVRNDIDELINGPARKQLENDILPAYLQKRRWFSQKDGKVGPVRIALATEMPRDGRPLMLVEIETKGRGNAQPERYQLPFGFFGEDETTTALPQQLAMARVRRGRQVGFLTDAFALAEFAHHIVKMLCQGTRIASADGELRFDSTSLLQEVMPALIAARAPGGVRWLSAEQSNSSLVIGDAAVLKVIRRVAAGINPEAEITRVLTERGFANTSPLLGEVSRVADDGTPHLLIVLQQFVHNQGDAWQWTLNVLTRVFRQVTVALPALPAEMESSPSTPEAARDTTESIEEMALGELQAAAGILGKRLGELHAVLAQDCDDEAFKPIRVDAAMASSWGEAAVRQIDAAMDVLEQKLGAKDGEATLVDGERDAAADLVGQRAALTAGAMKLAAKAVGSMATRIHGDFHLGQVLVTNGDAVIIDFEGEPAKPLAQRREMMSPLRDVAGLLRSIEYAAAMGLKSGPSDVGEAGEKKKREIVARYLPAAKQAFLATYDAESGRIGHAWKDDDGEAALLALFTFEKAAYELCYEAANRPTWIGVPLAGLVELAATLNKPAARTKAAKTSDKDAR